MLPLPRHIENPDPLIYESDNAFVLDFETTNIDYGDPTNPKNSLLLACARHVGTGELIVSWGNEFEQSYLLERLAEADYVIAQNTKFELGWLNRCGADIGKNLSFCTVIASYVYDGNVRNPRDLVSLSARYGVTPKEPHVARMIEEGICPSQILPEWLEEYCIQDVDTELTIFLKQREELRSAGLLPCAFTRNLLTPVLADIEFNGMQLDKERVGKVYAKYRNELDAITRDITEISGTINLNSPLQLAEFLYDVLKFPEPKNHYGKAIKTPGGARTTNAKHLAKLRPRTKKQKEFLDLYKRQSKLDDALTKYLAKFKECCDKDAGRLLAVFNQCVTVTHRLSSSGKEPYNAQFQNMDRNFKPLFRARNPGWVVCEADQAQLEYRAAVWLTDDKLGRERIASNFDIHSHTAEIMTAAGQPTNRQEAKSISFTPLFFGSSGTEAEQAYYRAFKEEHKEITKTHDEWIRQVLNHKSLTLPTGFVAYWPDTKLTSTGYVTNSTQICNYPVQHLATAEIVPIGVVYLWHLTRAYQMLCFLVSTIHDSVIGEVPPEEVELFQRLCREAMVERVLWYLKEVYGITFDVPLDLEHKATRFWNDSDKWQEDYLT